MKKHADKNAPLRVVLAVYLDALTAMQKTVGRHMMLKVTIAQTKQQIDKARQDPNYTLSERDVKQLNNVWKYSDLPLNELKRRMAKYCKKNCSDGFRFEYVPVQWKYHLTGKQHFRWWYADESHNKSIDLDINYRGNDINDVLDHLDYFKRDFVENEVDGGDAEYRLSNGGFEVSCRNPNIPNVVGDDVVMIDGSIRGLQLNGRPLTKKRLEKIMDYFKGARIRRFASVRKLSREATLHLLLQGMYKGLQEAKSDPLVQEKYPRGLSFIEGMVKDLGKKAARDPNFTLSEKQVKKLNQFLGGSSGVLSAVLRRHIVRHCSGNQCTMVSPNDFRFEYVKPLFHITGTLHIQSSERDDTYRIDKKVERLSEVLATYAVSMEGYTFGETEYSFERGVIKMESFHRNRSDVFDVNRMSSKLTLFVNGRPLPKALGEQAIKYFQRG